MEGLLNPVSTSYSKLNNDAADALVEVQISRPTPNFHAQASSPEEALDRLKSEPDYATLVSTLKYLQIANAGFDITSPSPVAAQLTNVLVSDILPNYWDVLSGEAGDKKTNPKSKGKTGLELLLCCLRSVTGMNAILFSLKQQIQKAKTPKRVVTGPNGQDVIRVMLLALQAILDGDETIHVIWKAICGTQPLPKQKAVWAEFLALLNGKIPGPAAEAEDIENELAKTHSRKYWVADGRLYSVWLARNISSWAATLSNEEDSSWKACGELLSKSFKLGYTDIIVRDIVSLLALQEPSNAQQLTKLIGTLPAFGERNFLYVAIKVIAQDYLSTEAATEDTPQWWKSDANKISAAACLIEILLASKDSRKSHLTSWLTSSSGAGVGEGIAIRRAVLAVLATEKDGIENVLEKMLLQFADKLYIKHTPAMQQEAHAQVLLLCAGYINRIAPLRLSMMTRNGGHLSLVSNRLAASSPRARFLGMVIGEALSSLVDKGDKRMDFKMEEMSTAEAKWYKSIVNVTDTIGTLELLKSGETAKLPKNSAPKAPKTQAISQAKPVPRASKFIAIEEVEDSDEETSDDDGFVPHAKPDSDAEDSDEDATLITRNKPTAPVYIRDLITYLRASEDYDKQKLALSTASPLIRRKANFGTEVSSHAEELAGLLVGLQDKYEIERFEEMRLQGMIAVLIALPSKMGQWFSKTFFDGDYSLSQRASILSTLGLGARELGGFNSDDNKLRLDETPQFPSKYLPESMHKRFSAVKALPPSPLENVSTQLQNLIIAPMATELADKLTGPSILKVRTFSSRMAVEKKRKKPIANELAKIVAESFFFPLTGRFFMHLKAYGSTKSNIVFQPQLLSLFIKTLSLLLHASGPSTLSLPQMTSEFWDLLLSLRTQSIGDITVIEALLFAFLTILEINEDKRRLVESHGRQMLETQEWVESVFGRFEAGGSEEDERARMLAAGCLLRIREVTEKYQALLMGDLAHFQS